MTTLTLTDSAIAPLSDLTDVLLLGQYQESVTDGGRTDVRTYAGGRRRVIARAGETRTVSVAYRYISRANYQSLLDLVGVSVLFRDQRQRQVYGVLSDVSGTEWPVSDLVEDVSFTISEIDYSEVV